jgi:prolyl oligopeptidase
MQTSEPADPFLWLEEVLEEPSLQWVRERNDHCQRVLQGRPEYAEIRSSMLEMMNSKERIPQVSRRGDYFYNLWQDNSHKRGLWRRTTLAEYEKAEPAWESVLNIDELAATEGENWVWAGALSLAPSHTRCLVSLSRGGADAAVVREFDLTEKAFVKGGFELAEAKSEFDWIDADTIYVGTDFGPGSMTKSGYPRVIKQWKRATPLASATMVFEVESTDMAAGVSVDHTPGFERTLFVRSIDFYRRQYFLLDADRLLRLDVPPDASIAFWNSACAAGDSRADTLLMELRSPLESAEERFCAGTLLAVDAQAFLDGQRRFDVLFTPTPTRSLAGYSTTRSHVIINVLDNVASRLQMWHRSAQGLEMREVTAPFPGTLGVVGLHDPSRANDPLAENYLLSYSDFLTPDTLWLAHTENDTRRTLKALPARFDASGMHAQQLFATSADGTQVPYFIVWPRGADLQPGNGTTPTILYGYGGFEVSLQPWYPAAFGSSWLARGGALVVANIRGGGEFGPNWHQAAQKANKQRSYDDFVAVAQDLVSRGVTNPRHLGIQGGSNGGLLVGAAFTQHPELFAAVVCSVPLLDMRRYHLLLAGASWMAEYGNPDLPEEWEYISRYSPYQNVKPGVKYPEVLFTTSTRDDRVHPGHARKMAARMLSQGHRVLYYENIEGGHGGAADNEQRAHVQALELSYLWRQLGPTS